MNEFIMRGVGPRVFQIYIERSRLDICLLKDLVEWELTVVVGRLFECLLILFIFIYFIYFVTSIIQSMYNKNIISYGLNTGTRRT